MSTKILDNLNDLEKATLEEYRLRWEKNLLSTGRELPSKPVLMEKLTELYKLAQLPAPKHVLTGTSINDCLDLIAFLLDKHNNGVDVASYLSSIKSDNVEQVIRERKIAEGKDLKSLKASERDYATYMIHDSYWLYWFEFLMDHNKLKGFDLSAEEIKNIEGLKPMIELAKSGTGWTWMYPDVAFVSEAPETLHVKISNNEYLLHNPSGPAMSFKDGTKAYAINNVIFTGEETKFVDTQADKLVPSEILAIKNVEQRQEIIKKFGVTKMYKDLNPKILDKWTDELGNPYELLEIDIGMRPNRIYISMKNPSVPETHLEAVHPDCRTVQQALAWRTYDDHKLAYRTPLALT